MQSQLLLRTMMVALYQIDACGLRSRGTRMCNANATQRQEQLKCSDCYIKACDDQYPMLHSIDV